MSIFSEKLIELRKQKNLTQDDLAKLTNISRSAISLYEIGKREPDFDTTKRLADFFNCSIDYLLGRSEKKSTDLADVIREKEITYQGNPVDKEQLRKALLNIGAAAHTQGELYEGDVGESLIDDLLAVIERAKKSKKDRSK